MSKPIPELAFLRTEVERTYGRALSTTTAFESLSVVIEHDTGELVSASTLKRLWGYVSLAPTPRLSTLDVLSRYIGKRDFKAFCAALKKEAQFESTFFTAKFVASDTLAPGARVTIGWKPDRIVQLRYLGSSAFEVTASERSKLRVGDRFECAHFLLGYPLYLARIHRDGADTPPFVAARTEGLNLLKINSFK